MKWVLPLLFVVSLYASPTIDPDIEIKIPGLVCQSCAIGVKRGLKKTNLIKAIKFNVEEIHPSQIKKIVKDAGYEVRSIKWLKDKKPNRYNKP